VIGVDHPSYCKLMHIDGLQGVEVGCPFRVIRVILSVRRSLPVFPDKRTIPEPVKWHTFGTLP
jgi:hypothetical protein